MNQPVPARQRSHTDPRREGIENVRGRINKRVAEGRQSGGAGVLGLSAPHLRAIAVQSRRPTVAGHES